MLRAGELSLLGGIFGCNFGQMKSLIGAGNFSSSEVKTKKKVIKPDIALFIALFSFKKFPYGFVGFIFKYPHSCSRRPHASKKASNAVHKAEWNMEERILHEKEL